MIGEDQVYRLEQLNKSKMSSEAKTLRNTLVYIEHLYKADMTTDDETDNRCGEGLVWSEELQECIQEESDTTKALLKSKTSEAVSSEGRPGDIFASHTPLLKASRPGDIFKNYELNPYAGSTELQLRTPLKKEKAVRIRPGDLFRGR